MQPRIFRLLSAAPPIPSIHTAREPKAQRDSRGDVRSETNSRLTSRFGRFPGSCHEKKKYFKTKLVWKFALEGTSIGPHRLSRPLSDRADMARCSGEEAHRSSLRSFWPANVRYSRLCSSSVRRWARAMLEQGGVGTFCRSSGDRRLQSSQSSPMHPQIHKLSQNPPLPRPTAGCHHHLFRRSPLHTHFREAI